MASQNNPTRNTKVRCGLAPSSDVQYFDITTSYAERFLGDQIRRLEDEMRNTLRKKDPNAVVQPAKIRLLTFELGANFYPYLISMSDSVLMHKDSGNTPAIFQPQADDEGVPVKQLYWEFLKNFRFDKYDRADFRDSRWRREVKIHNMKSFNVLTRFSNPSIQKFDNRNGGSIKNVVMLIDPLKLWKYMLSDPSSPNENFAVYPEAKTHLNGQNYSFKIRRESSNMGMSEDQLQKTIKDMIMKDMK